MFSTGMAVATLESVPGSKSLPDEMQTHLAKELKSLEATRFVDVDGEPWNQTRIGVALGCSQSQVSDLRQGRKWGATNVVALSRESGKTIDELLGPTAPAYLKAHRNRITVEKTLELFDLIDGFRSGWAGKNLQIPLLMKEIRQLLKTPETEAFLSKMRLDRQIAEAAMAKRKRQKKLEKPEKAG